jgi:hypothetical protein
VVTRERFGDIYAKYTDGGGDPYTDDLGDIAHSDERGVTASAGDPVAIYGRLMPDRNHRPNVWSEPDSGMTGRDLQVRSS